MNLNIKSITIAALLATTAPVAALAQADTSADTNADTSATADTPAADVAAAGNAGMDASYDNYGQVISRIRTGGAAGTADFSDFEIGTDGEVTIVALSDLQGEGAENGREALDTAVADAAMDADYSELPDGTFEGTDYDEDDVVVAFIDAEGNLVVVVDDSE